jgi:hypothetical protein
MLVHLGNKIVLASIVKILTIIHALILVSNKETIEDFNLQRLEDM